MPSMCWIFSSLLVSCRQSSEPPVENGLIPYLGCALQFGANPLQFLRSRQKKYGHIFTCKIAGQYIHFLCDPFSYHSVIRQGRHLDWRKFHFATSVKVFVGFHRLAYDCGFMLRVLLGLPPHPKSRLFLTRHLATTASTLVMATPRRTSTKLSWRPCRAKRCPPSSKPWWAISKRPCWNQTHSAAAKITGRWMASSPSATRSVIWKSKDWKLHTVLSRRFLSAAAGDVWIRLLDSLW